MINFKNILNDVMLAAKTSTATAATTAVISTVTTCSVDKILTGDFNAKEHAVDAAVNAAATVAITTATTALVSTVTEIAADIKRKRDDKKLLEAAKEQGIYIDENGVCHLAEPELDSCNCCD